ncbi:MAG: CRISPR-associated endonuclease Cas2 [Gammaproteobacteria bacterium]|nr:MAG: CRISPR-associated endonuclease Cas2 [Gammaproteobacteria bacterium]
MSTRRLYIAAYDIADAKRLRSALKILKRYACGRQKSVFECYLTPAEYWRLVREMRDLIVPEKDRFLVIRHDPVQCARVLGKAVAPADPDWFYVG